MREIRQDPDSDAPRLVCADWLIDRGELRGDYIVIACRHDPLPRHSAEARALRELLAKFRRHTREWLKPLVALGAKRGSDAPSFTRGFVTSVRLFGGAAFNLPAMCRIEPIVDLVLARCAHSAFRPLAEAPEIAGLRQLWIDDDNPRSCEHLLASPYLAGLSELRISPRWPPEIAEAAAHGTIRPIRLKLGAIERPELAVLVDAGFFSRLEDYAHTQPTSDLIIELARAPLTRLRRLALDTAHLSARAFDALGERLDQLEHLSLGGRQLSPDIAEILIAYMRSGNLRSLRYTGTSGEGFDRFVSSPAFRGVEELHVPWGPFDAAMIERSPYRGNLRMLRLGRSMSGVQLPGVDVQHEPAEALGVHASVIRRPDVTAGG